MWRKIIISLSAVLIVGLLVLVLTNLAVENFAHGRTYSSVKKIEKNKVGLVLGTSKYLVGGGINLYFKYRIDAAVKLYRSGKIDFILVSGDNSVKYYNEPRYLKETLISRGIPSDKIFMDFAGFHTLDSVIRAHKVFGQDSITIISQKFHNERAIYIAEKNGIHAVGFNAKNPKGNLSLKIREYFARTKAYFDVLFGTQPKFLGKPITIE